VFCLFAELAKEKPSTLFAVNTSAIKTIQPDASDHVIAREYERAESSGFGGVLKAPRATVATPELRSRPMSSRRTPRPFGQRRIDARQQRIRGLTN